MQNGGVGGDNFRGSQGHSPLKLSDLGGLGALALGGRPNVLVGQMGI
jgi:hypothetical protein